MLERRRSGLTDGRTHPLIETRRRILKGQALVRGRNRNIAEGTDGLKRSGYLPYLTLVKGEAAPAEKKESPYSLEIVKSVTMGAFTGPDVYECVICSIYSKTNIQDVIDFVAVALKEEWRRG